MSAVEAPLDPADAVDARGASVGRPFVVALVGLCLVVAAILVWAIFGRAPQTVSGFGYVVPQGGYTEVGTQVVGVVQSVGVQPGQRVRAGDEMVRIDIADGDADIESIVSPVDGIVTEIVALPGRATEPGDPMIYLQPIGAPLIVKGFVSATQAGTIATGMPASVSPADAPRRAQYGAIVGTVTALSPAPVTPERIGFIVGGNDSLVDYFLGSGPVIEVTVELQLDPSTPSGYAWSIGQGPDVEIKAGTLSEVTVVVRETPVIGWFTQ
jgi:multidrug efflux pump subunit AcrA (membrane-fusion protein)